jgi:hypothetical protein
LIERETTRESKRERERERERERKRGDIYIDSGFSVSGLWFRV